MFAVNHPNRPDFSPHTDRSADTFPEDLPGWPLPVDHQIPPLPFSWSAEDRERMCGCGHPEQHSDDRGIRP